MMANLPNGQNEKPSMFDDMEQNDWLNLKTLIFGNWPLH